MYQWDVVSPPEQAKVSVDCWKCGKRVSETPIKIGFRALCIHCDCDLHVCKNCRYYSPGKPNDCAVPGTERIRDREAFNFCEEFRPRISSSAPSTSTAVEKAQRILGGEDVPKKRDFDSLFRDKEDQ